MKGISSKDAKYEMVADWLQQPGRIGEHFTWHKNIETALNRLNIVRKLAGYKSIMSKSILRLRIVDKNGNQMASCSDPDKIDMTDAGQAALSYQDIVTKNTMAPINPSI